MNSDVDRIVVVGAILARKSASDGKNGEDGTHEAQLLLEIQVTRHGEVSVFGTTGCLSYAERCDSNQAHGPQCIVETVVTCLECETSSGDLGSIVMPTWYDAGILSSRPHASQKKRKSATNVRTCATWGFTLAAQPRLHISRKMVVCYGRKCSFTTHRN